MDYGQGISGCYVGGTGQIHTGNGYAGIHSKELKQDLLITLLEHPEITKKLGFLTKNDTLTDKAINELLIGLTVNRDKCFGNIPQWKLDWYSK